MPVTLHRCFELQAHSWPEAWPQEPQQLQKTGLAFKNSTFQTKPLIRFINHPLRQKDGKKGAIHISTGFLHFAYGGWIEVKLFNTWCWRDSRMHMGFVVWWMYLVALEDPRRLMATKCHKTPSAWPLEGTGQSRLRGNHPKSSSRPPVKSYLDILGCQWFMGSDSNLIYYIGKYNLKNGTTLHDILATNKGVKPTKTTLKAPALEAPLWNLIIGQERKPWLIVLQKIHMIWSHCLRCKRRQADPPTLKGSKWNHPWTMDTSTQGAWNSSHQSSEA